MNPERWQLLKQYFHEAEALGGDQRTAYIQRVCGDDMHLRRELEELLEANDEAPPLLEQNPMLLLHGGAQAHEASLEGTRIGSYRIHEVIGRGGMGSVYRAQRADGQFQQEVALKVVRRGLDTEDILSRFRYERQILASLDHPHIASLIDGGMTKDGRPYFVMEYVDGQPLTDYCDTNRLTTPQRLALFRTVCRAVQYAHQNLIIHRDLKPSNILVTAEGTVKLLDFGIAKLLTEEQVGDDQTVADVPVTRTGWQLMTPEYASPEQVRGGRITTATDVYQLGVLLYELLTGQRPYRLPSRMRDEIGRVIMQEEPTRPSTLVADTGKEVGAARRVSTEQLRRELSGDLDNIVLMALKKDPGERYSTVELLAEDIRRHLGGLPVVAHRDSVAYRLGKFIRRNRVGVSAAALVLVSLVGGLAGTMWQAQVAAAERDRAQLEARKAQQTAAFLVDLFEASDPQQQQGDEQTARELLEAGEAKITRELADQPAVRAALLSVMGQVYHNMGRYGQAEALLREALSVQQAIQRAPDATVAETKRYLAELYRAQGAYAAADSLLADVLRLQQQVLGDEHAEIALTLRAQAGVYEGQGRMDQAEQAFRRALAMQERLLEVDDPEVSVTMNNLAVLLQQKGDYAEAERYYQLSLAEGQRILGEDHPSNLETAYNIGHLLYTLGDVDAADSIYRAVLPRYRAVYGGQHPDVAFLLNSQASVLYDLGDEAGTEAAYQEALAIYRATVSETSPDLLRVLNNYGWFLGAVKQDYPASAEVFAEVLAIRREILPDPHPDIALSLHNLASVYHRMDHPRAAVPLLEEALVHFNATLPDGHLRTARTQQRLAQCLVDLQRPADAEPLLLAAYAVFQTNAAADSATVQRARRQLAELYEAWGKPEQAAAYHTEATAPAP